jgi:hypothetical protein
LAPIFSRKSAKRTSSSLSSAPPDTPRTPCRSLCSPSTTSRGTNVLDVVDNGDRIRSPPSKKVRVACHCCDCTHGMCMYGGGPNGGRNDHPCRRSSHPCELSCARPECQNQGTQSTPPNSTAGSFWKPQVSDLELWTSTLHRSTGAGNASQCYPITVGQGTLGTTQQNSPSPIRGGVALLQLAANLHSSNGPTDPPCQPPKPSSSP